MTSFFNRGLLFKSAALFVAPFALAIGSWELALLFPGHVATLHWHFFSSLSFVVAGLWVVVSVLKTGLGAITKGICSGALVSFFLLFGFMFSLQSRCGDEQLFIGQQAQGTQFASCQ